MGPFLHEPDDGSSLIGTQGRRLIQSSLEWTAESESNGVDGRAISDRASGASSPGVGRADRLATGTLTPRELERPHRSTGSASHQPATAPRPAHAAPRVTRPQSILLTLLTPPDATEGMPTRVLDGTHASEGAVMERERTRFAMERMPLKAP